MGTCSYQFHGVSRRDNGDGTVTLTLDGWSYTSNAERKAGAGPVRHAPEPCATRTVPARYAEYITGQRIRVYESADAAAMVTWHCGDPYVPVFQGRGWTVEIRAGYPLWQVTS